MNVGVFLYFKIFLLAAIVGFCIFIGVSPTFSDSPASADNRFFSESVLQDTGMFVVGEELIYNVSYAFLDIGQIRIKVLEKVSSKGHNHYRTIAYLDSYSGIPFVDLHTIYESHVDRGVFSRLFRSRVKDETRWYATLYEFDYSGQKMYVRKGWWGSNVVDLRDSLRVDTLYQDGLSLYYCARQHLRSNRRAVIPTIIQEEKVRTIIDFINKQTSTVIDAVKYPIDVIEFEGNAEFVGVFGMTGAFQGWFSNDDARVPILAKMKVIIGNVRIELMKWNRPGWNPPQYIERTDK